MNEEEKTITASEPAAEKQTKPTKPKRTDEEKLQECYERRDRLREQKTAHKNKGQVIDKSIAENNAKIAELENKEILKTLKEKEITAQELIGFLKKMPEGVTLEMVEKRVFHRIPPHSDQPHFNNTV
jgi:NH3-dependent NAD+ synthetase